MVYNYSCGLVISTLDLQVVTYMTYQTKYSQHRFCGLRAGWALQKAPLSLQQRGHREILEV